VKKRFAFWVILHSHACCVIIRSTLSLWLIEDCRIFNSHACRVSIRSTLSLWLIEDRKICNLSHEPGSRLCAAPVLTPNSNVITVCLIQVTEMRDLFGGTAFAHIELTDIHIQWLHHSERQPSKFGYSVLPYFLTECKICLNNLLYVDFLSFATNVIIGKHHLSDCIISIHNFRHFSGQSHQLSTGLESQHAWTSILMWCGESNRQAWRCPPWWILQCPPFLIFLQVRSGSPGKSIAFWHQSPLHQSINPCNIVSNVDYCEIHFFHRYIFYCSVHFFYAAGGPHQTLSIFPKSFYGTDRLGTFQSKTMVHIYCLPPLLLCEDSFTK
jgi:hypothetical protein